MAETPSNMLPLGTKASYFTLIDVISNKKKSLNDLKSDKATVIMFICNHCPFVKHINNKLVEIANKYIERGISFIAINSNDVENYPEDSPDKMAKQAKDLKYPFPYLFDETQDVAKAYNAACTPDIFLFDKDLKLVYRGQFDDSRPGNNKPVTGNDLANALDLILSGDPISEEQIPSVGCNIKWKK
jgi:thiol-disulfide isomerase/thioredoxin